MKALEAEVSKHSTLGSESERESAYSYAGSEQGGGSGFPEGFGSLPLELRLQAPVVCDGFEWQGFLPESMPAAYDDFIMEVTCHHPQWLELQRVRW